MRKFLLLFALISASLVVPMSGASAGEVGPCDTNYFPDEDMWEITWGLQFDDTGGTATFTMESYGGLTGVNGGDVPAYMTDYEGDPGWQWLYVTRTQVEEGRTVTYEFADGTVITAEVSGDADGCPSVVWTTAAPGQPDPEEPTTPTSDPAPTTTPTTAADTPVPAAESAGAAAPVQAAPDYTG